MPIYDNISRELIRKERKVELAFEGNRYWDLVRWRIAADELSHSFHSLRFILDGNSYTEGNFDVITAKYKLKIIEDLNGIRWEEIHIGKECVSKVTYVL